MKSFVFWLKNFQKVIHKVQINNKPALVQVMVWRWRGNICAGISLGMRPANERHYYNDVSHWLGAYLDLSLQTLVWSNDGLVY